MGLLVEFLRHPRRTGAVMPSSRMVVRELLRGLDLTSARCVVELGAGDGAVTGALLRRLPPGARLIAVELNPMLAEQLRRRYVDDPVEVVTGSAVDLPSMLGERGVNLIDHVISGLPWTAMEPAERDNTVRAVSTVLSDLGEFRSLVCLHAIPTTGGRRFGELLRERFSVVRRGEVVWWNVPPLVSWCCAGPVRRSLGPAARVDLDVADAAGPAETPSP